MAKDLAVYVDRIDIFNDKDGWGRGAGDIYIKYNVNDGVKGESGTLGEYSIHGGKGKVIGERIAVLDDVDDVVSLNFSVWDNDWPDSDDHLGTDLQWSFSAAQNFGIGHHHYVTDDYSLDFSIVSV